MDHFVVLKEVKGNRVVVHDPAFGRRIYTLTEAGRHFTGIALELIPTGGFEKKKDVARLPLSTFWGRLKGANRALGQALVLSLLLQVVLLASPFYMQLVVDDAVMKNDGNLLTALALGFGLLLLINIAATWLRSQVLLYFGNALNFQMSANLFNHLVRLPLEWFEKRHIGDIVSRFGATAPIQTLFSQGLIGAVVDGVMAVLTFIMILVYSPVLSLVVIAAFAIYALLRVVTYRAFRQRQEEVIEASAREATAFMETARAIQSIKIFGREADREALWQNRHAEVINRSIEQQRLSIGFGSANQLIYGLENVLVVYLGARAVIAGDMTIGMLYAFMAYKEQFLDKITNLIEMGIQYRMLDLYLSRLSDIALTDQEPGYRKEALVARHVDGAITLRDITFRYAETEPETLSGVNLHIEPGEFVAITGPSGGGKTTLLKVMLGLFKPKTGSVLIDNVPLDHLGLQTFRAQIGVVMQDDHMLSGTSRREHHLLRHAAGYRMDPRMRAQCRHRRRDHGDADELRHPGGRHGHDPLRRSAPARAPRPRPLPPAADPVHGRGHLQSRSRQGAGGEPRAGETPDHPRGHRPPPRHHPGGRPDDSARRRKSRPRPGFRIP